MAILAELEVVSAAVILACLSSVVSGSSWISCCFEHATDSSKTDKLMIDFRIAGNFGDGI